MKYYLKRCGFQELGSLKDGKPQRGRYLLTSMNQDVLDMFPSLSKTQLNDSALLPIIPLYSGKKIYCNFVYHNDKYNGSTSTHPRNEYRLYLNKELEEHQLLFSQGDIIVIRKDNIVSNGENQGIYYLDYVKSINIGLYNKLNKIIDDNNINGGYGIFEGTISEFEDKVKKINVFMDSEVAIDETVTEKIADSSDRMANLFNSISFRDFIMFGYDNLCAITGTVIKYESYTNLEAAHIKPKSHGGLFLPNNGIALCRDMHWAFDKGFFTLDDDFKLIVHPKITSEYLNSFNGKKIRTPNNPFFKPNLDNVQYHRNNIFGLFLKTGKL